MLNVIYGSILMYRFDSLLAHIRKRQLQYRVHVFMISVFYFMVYMRSLQSIGQQFM